MEIDSMPAELDEVKRRIMQLEIRARSAAQGEGLGVEGPPAKIDKELANLKEQQTRLMAHWEQRRKPSRPGAS